MEGEVLASGCTLALGRVNAAGVRGTFSSAGLGSGATGRAELDPGAGAVGWTVGYIPVGGTALSQTEPGRAGTADGRVDPADTAGECAAPRDSGCPAWPELIRGRGQHRLAEVTATGWAEVTATGWADVAATGWAEVTATGWADVAATGWAEVVRAGRAGDWLGGWECDVGGRGVCGN